MDTFDLQTFMALSGQHYPDHGNCGRRAVCFASGSNCIPEIRGFSALGIPPGLAAAQLVGREGDFSAAVTEIEALAGTGMPVFLDSGAFGEFRSGVEISEKTWFARLALYEHLAKILGPQLYVVAPDKVCNQPATLERLQHFSFEMRNAADYGAQVILPLQSGDLAPDEFQAAAQEILSLEVIPAFPMWNGITSPETVLAFVRATRPEKIHLLGLGAANRKTQDLLDGLWDIKSDLLISQDAMLLKSRLGTEEKPRKFDHTTTSSRSICDGAYDVDRAWDLNWDFTEMIGDPSNWLPETWRKDLAKQAGLSKKEVALFAKDPTSLMNMEFEPGYTYWENSWLSQGLDAAWKKYLLDETAGRRRAWAIVKAFGDHPAAGQFNSVFAQEIDPGGELDAHPDYEGLEAFCRENELSIPTLENKSLEAVC